MFWTAGQRWDVTSDQPTPFFWKSTPGSLCCGGTCMWEMAYTFWKYGEPNNLGSYDANLNVAAPRVREKCLQLCSGWQYQWNDALCEIPTCSICELYDVEA